MSDHEGYNDLELRRVMEQVKSKAAEQIKPPPQKYYTSDGLEFWMDHQSPEQPFIAPTIRTSDPDISIIFVPTPMHHGEVFLFCFHGQKFGFSRPDAASRLHNDDLEKLASRNPELDFVISSVCFSEVEWMTPYHLRKDDENAPQSITLQLDTDLGSGAQKHQIISLFCELMAWATEGPLAMVRGAQLHTQYPWGARKVGFDKPLARRLGIDVPD